MDNSEGQSHHRFLLARAVEVSRQTSSKLKYAVMDLVRGNVQEGYQKLEALLQLAVSINPGSHYGIEKTSSGLFQHACFFPGACLQARTLSKNVVGLDGAHLKGETNKRGVFLVATAKDRNNHLLVFGLAVVSVENYDYWRWFLKQLNTAVSSTIAEFKPGFVSNRQKGLIAAVADEFPGIGHRFCLRHIITNISKKGCVLTRDQGALIFAMAGSECENDYSFYRSQLREKSPTAATYLDGLDKSC
jgi:hypothetical protein